MIKTLMASVAATVLTLSFSGPAFADCAEEIAALKSEQYTGSIGTSADAGAPEERIDEAHAAAGTAAESDTPVAGEVPGTQATAAMNQAVGGRATSAEDVRKQDAGEPTVAQQAEAAEGAPDAHTQITAEETGTVADQFTVLLTRAEEYQKLGNEEACMNVIEEAQALVQ
jgi:hypothetical protein